MSQSVPHCLLYVEAELDPHAPARVLGLVTRSNVFPSWFSARPMRGGGLRIVVELEGLQLGAVERLAGCIAEVPGVVSVSHQPMDRRTPVMT